MSYYLKTFVDIVHLQITAGRPRPDFLARCQPPLDAQDPPRGLSNYTICTTPIDSYEMKDGYKSFPSGHASCKLPIFHHTCIPIHLSTLVSFAGLGYLAFYLAGKMQLFDERGVRKIYTIIRTCVSDT